MLVYRKLCPGFFLKFSNRLLQGPFTHFAYQFFKPCKPTLQKFLSGFRVPCIFDQLIQSRFNLGVSPQMTLKARLKAIIFFFVAFH